MLSIPHLIIIFVVALIVFGPDKLPDLARNLGKVMGEFKRATTDLRSTFEGHLRDLEREADQRRIGGALPPPVPAPPAPGTIQASPPNLFTGAPEDEFPTPPPAESAPEASSTANSEQPEPVSDGSHRPA